MAQFNECKILKEKNCIIENSNIASYSFCHSWYYSYYLKLHDFGGISGYKDTAELKENLKKNKIKYLLIKDGSDLNIIPNSILNHCRIESPLKNLLIFKLNY